MSLRDLSWDPTHIRSWHVQIPTGRLPRPSYLPTSIGFYAQMSHAAPASVQSSGQTMSMVGSGETFTTTTAVPLGNHLLVAPVTATPYFTGSPLDFDSSTTHPASVASQRVSQRDTHTLHDSNDDVRCCHPASSRFFVPIHTRQPPRPRGLAQFVPLTPDPPRPRPRKQVVDVSTTHPASVDSSSADTLSEQDRSDTAITHPASSSFIAKPDFDPATTHPASVMSTQQVSFAVKAITEQRSPIDVTSVHPAFVSQTSTRPFIPSDVRSVHPASNAFVSLDPRTTHPASVVPYNGRRPDEGNAAVSHPAWVGFGYANPHTQSSRL